MKTVFTSREASAVTGLTQRQLAYWRSSALIPPSHRTAGGHARYTFTDLIALKTARRLLDSGVSLQRIRRSIASLLRLLPALGNPLSELSLVATGDVVLVLRGDAAFEAVSGQEWIFPIAQIHRDIARLQGSDTKDEPRQRELFPDSNHTSGPGSSPGGQRAAQPPFAFTAVQRKPSGGVRT